MYSILIYGFPVILVGFEFLVRFLIDIDTYGFVGPTLASAGITALVSTVRPKTFEVRGEDGKRHLVTSKMDHRFIALAWLLLFAMLFAWAAICYASLFFSDYLIFGIQAQAVLGIITYMFCSIMVGVKSII